MIFFANFTSLREFPRLPLPIFLIFSIFIVHLPPPSHLPPPLTVAPTLRIIPHHATLPKEKTKFIHIYIHVSVHSLRLKYIIVLERSLSTMQQIPSGMLEERGETTSSNSLYFFQSFVESFHVNSSFRNAFCEEYFLFCQCIPSF